MTSLSLSPLSDSVSPSDSGRVAKMLKNVCGFLLCAPVNELTRLGQVQI